MTIVKKTKPANNAKPFAETAKPMSGDAFDAALGKLDISQSAFARLIGVGDRTVRSWISGEFPVPMTVGYLVRLMIDTKTKPEDLKL
jgi:DNA-binding transcriptional regulator YiaG